MKHTLIKSLVGTAALCGLSLALSAPALANSGNLNADCQFTGHANVFAAPVQYVGGGGSFGFDGSANCAGEVNSGPSVQLGLSLSASGNYQSLVCGTSNLNGSATGTASLNGGADGTSAFSIPFVGGQGVITGSFTGSGPYAGASGAVAGAVTIFPNNPATAAVVGGASNAAQNPTPVDLSGTVVGPIIFSGGAGPGSTSSTCVNNYGVAGDFVITTLANNPLPYPFP